ncbi:MAG: hypothetical protein RID91_16050 [Azospirillaceae bacterium]
MTSIREEAVRALRTKIEGLDLFDLVDREPMPGRSDVRNTCSIAEGAETKQPGTACWDCTLPVDLVIFWYRPREAELAAELNDVLRQVVDALLVDSTLGGAVIWVRERRNEMILDFEGDPVGQLVVTLELRYRHAEGSTENVV